MGSGFDDDDDDGWLKCKGKKKNSFLEAFPYKLIPPLQKMTMILEGKDPKKQQVLLSDLAQYVRISNLKNLI